MSKLRNKFPELFNEEQQEETTEEVKVMKKTHKKATKATTTNTDTTKEMVRVLLANKKRNYSNHDIAEMTGLSVHQVAAMAAWEHPNLKKKRK